MYESDEIAPSKLELTDGTGVDQLLDVVGGDGINQSIEATRVGGQIFQIGFLQGQKANIDPFQKPLVT